MPQRTETFAPRRAGPAERAVTGEVRGAQKHSDAGEQSTLGQGAEGALTPALPEQRCCSGQACLLRGVATDSLGIT